MPNILNNPDYWFGGSTDANGNFTLQVHGSYSTESNKTLEWSGNGDPPTPYEIKAQVVCNISNFDAYQWNSLYFYVYSYQLQGLIHLETILEAGSAPSNDYTFDLDVTADNISQGIVMGVTDAPNYAWGAPPGPYGYEQIGQIQIIPVADPVEPPEPVERPMITAKVSVLVTRMLPWWMCLPKKPVTPCPVRPTGFVPFSQYDSEFKFPLASSRKPSRIRRDEDCVACRPVVGDENTAPTPTPEPDPPVPECISNLMISGTRLVHMDGLPVEQWGGIFAEGAPIVIVIENANASVRLRLGSWMSTYDTYIRDDNNGWPLEDEFSELPYSDTGEFGTVTLSIMDTAISGCAKVCREAAA